MGRQEMLLTRCAAAAREVDEEIAAPLSPGQRAALHQALGLIAEREGLSTGGRARSGDTESGEGSQV